MDKLAFENILQQKQNQLEEIRLSAWALHDSVGQHYDHEHPYGFHLSMVADAAMRHGSQIVASADDVVPVVFAAYYHDSIEDARLSYNDVRRLALRWMTDEQAFMAAEIVYALTNEKGRTRQERAGEKYFDGIRHTPYAPFIKLCDRWANMQYSHQGTNESNRRMQQVYAREWPSFLQQVSVQSADSRYALPSSLLQDIETIVCM